MTSRTFALAIALLSIGIVTTLYLKFRYAPHVPLPHEGHLVYCRIWQDTFLLKNTSGQCDGEYIYYTPDYDIEDSSLVTRPIWASDITTCRRLYGDRRRAVHSGHCFF